MMMNSTSFTRARGFTWMCVLIVTASLAGAGGRSSLSAQKNAKPAKGKTSAPPPRLLVWPLPPDPPRIRYVTSYHGVNDFKTKKPGRWKTLLLGEEDASLKPSDALVKPYGIAVSDDGRVFVSDTAARRVFTFDPDSKTVSFVGESGTGKLTKPIGVAVGDEGRVFVADATLNRVFAYGPDGRVVLAMGQEGELKAPSGLAADRVNKRIYVADAALHHILCYSAVDGTLLKTIGQRGDEPGNFNFPTNLFVDNKGRLYVTDTMNFRVQVLDADGRVVRVFGTQGDTGGSLNRPKGVGVDSEGHIYVADTSFNNFQVFDPEGHLLLFVGSGGIEPGEFQLPAGLYVDTRDRIYVADQGNSRVQVFQYLKAAAR
jgi:DNA-binding beta-propeller fold protein YncE